MTSRPSYFVMIFLVRITTTFLPTKNVEVTSDEDFSIAEANRRGRTGGVTTTCSGRNSSRVGTVHARDLSRVLYPRSRTRQSRVDVRKCKRGSRPRGACH